MCCYLIFCCDLKNSSLTSKQKTSISPLDSSSDHEISLTFSRLAARPSANEAAGDSGSGVSQEETHCVSLLQLEDDAWWSRPYRQGTRFT